MSLFVISTIADTKNMAGIPHTNAVKNIHGSALFGFRRLPIAAKFALAIDFHMRHNSNVFDETLMSPISELSKGDFITLHTRPSFNNVNRPFERVTISRVKEEEILNYASAMQISVILLSEKHKEIYVEDILSPARSVEFSAGYLNYLFNDL
ncbi:hypothetical protein PBCVNY2B_898L [Paramecium bursaria Chlorella virus NY2B]|uniref:Uncharacterized protein n=1 Tax=Paramecium bursaria Chlorella virus NYs1 TaxID=83442 RepID=M1I9F5_9PHYC|nr:hypothetical protein AR158_C781L [Paramecium bursaria Chlorella virus AR158]YP_009665576.1 hypothetical protein FK949_gp194 [Paramecium bursaria Chlorella virus NYs1]AGE54434.1 hypothetical protein PBCVIL52s1_911L [Paramecium bursaria Chlorella virus IL-5-2s1]AGE55114.1 hypothetical protein PBCVMA1D_887L [Paramecium bursaria Chlorella virus MA1D]AGE58554.1 hypothetical protein PBCVNY2B_898L [Paramecium bursaria Chlorella virus NY2B]ABU44326.1 hypothetical protein AR158_C781L [Paramecium bur